MEEGSTMSDEQGGIYSGLYQAQFKDYVSDDEVIEWSEGAEWCRYGVSVSGEVHRA